MAPFTVLHVCMGNICRSPMAERLLVVAARHRLAKLGADGGQVDAVLRSRSAGTGGWHQGEDMNPPAARQILLRGGSVDGFAARRLGTAHLAEADLILTATADQLDYVLALRPDLAARTFVLGHLGRLLSGVDGTALPPAGVDPAAVAARGAAVVAAADKLRGGSEALPDDDLDDPWGRGDQTFTRVADEIATVLDALVDVLLPLEVPRP